MAGDDSVPVVIDVDVFKPRLPSRGMNRENAHVSGRQAAGGGAASHAQLTAAPAASRGLPVCEPTIAQGGAKPVGGPCGGSQALSSGRRNARLVQSLYDALYDPCRARARRVSSVVVEDACRSEKEGFF